MSIRFKSVRPYGVMLLALFVPLFANAATLDLTISDVRGDEGQVMLQVSSSGAEFTGESEPPTVSIMQRAQRGSMAMQLALPEGTYAIRVMHDRNGNGELDTNFVGLPKEPFGFSNNVVGRLGPATWQDAQFDLSVDRVLNIRLNH